MFKIQENGKPDIALTCPGDTVQTGTGKVDPARKFKCTTAASGLLWIWTWIPKTQFFNFLPFLTLSVRNGPSVSFGTNFP